MKRTEALIAAAIGLGMVTAGATWLWGGWGLFAVGLAFFAVVVLIGFEVPGTPTKRGDGK